MDSNISLAPIVLFVYNRPWHTQQTLDALAKNELAKESVLYIFADGPRENANLEDLKKIDDVEKIIVNQNGFKDVIIRKSIFNKGLADSIVEGITEIVNKYGKIIVLEDDIVTSIGFLKYMNEALSIYENDTQVFEVTGFMFPLKKTGLPDTFFYNANSCWGWGTWKRAWDFFESDAQLLYDRLIEKGINWESYNAYQGDAFRLQLIQNINNDIRTWAVKWHTVIKLKKGFVLHPKKSLTKNIGFDGTGVHCEETNIYINIELAEKIKVQKIITYNENYKAIIAIKNYFQTTGSNLLFKKMSAITKNLFRY